MSRLEDRGVPLLGAVFLGVVAVGLWFGLGLGAGALDAALRGVSLAEGESRVRQSLALSTLIQALAMGTTLVVGLRWFEHESPAGEALHLFPVRLRVLSLCLLAGACLQFPLTELANVLHHHVFGPDPIEQQLAIKHLLEARSPLEGTVVVGCLAGIVPLTEELLFRGFFFHGLSRRYGVGIGLVGSALLFGLAHISPVPIVYAATAGLVLGVVAWRTGSVWPGVAVHAAVNAVPVLLPERLVRIQGFNVPSVAPTHLEPWLVWPPLALGILALLAVFKLSSGASHE